jgi:type II secretory pathway pseudopilin PulG
MQNDECRTKKGICRAHRSGAKRSGFHSAFCIPHSAFPRRRGYTLVELFLTLAVLMIVLGLMRNLANRVRTESADRLTRQLLAQLDQAMADYRTRYGELPPIQPVAEPGQVPTESALQILAKQNNADFVRYLNLSAMAKHSKPGDDALAESFNAGVVEDPWGSPIIFMPQQHPAIGMGVSGDVFFFASAGPDRQYLTHDDNFYSFEK